MCHRPRADFSGLRYVYETNGPHEFALCVSEAVGQLEEAYLTSEDPMRQLGFGGGAERWRREREPIVPFGIDQGSKLIELARKRLPQFAGHFEVDPLRAGPQPERLPHIAAPHCLTCAGPG